MRTTLSSTIYSLRLRLGGSLSLNSMSKSGASWWRWWSHRCSAYCIVLTAPSSMFESFLGCLMTRQVQGMASTERRFAEDIRKTDNKAVENSEKVGHGPGTTPQGKLWFCWCPRSTRRKGTAVTSKLPDIGTKSSFLERAVPHPETGVIPPVQPNEAITVPPLRQGHTTKTTSLSRIGRTRN